MSKIHPTDRIQARQNITKEHKLRTEPKVKPIMRAEDEFECLKTLWSSEDLKFDIEIHRVGLALLMQLAGITGNRPKALLQLRFKDVTVALLPDPHGSEWPRLMIEWKFNTTKTYKGAKDAFVYEFPIWWTRLTRQTETSFLFQTFPTSPVFCCVRM